MNRNLIKGDLVYICDILGHTKTSTTEIYAKYMLNKCEMHLKQPTLN